MNKTKKSKPKSKSKKINSSLTKKILNGPLSFVAVFCLLGMATLGVSFAARNGGSVARFDKAALQPTDWGKWISALEAYNGKIYAGYGDWDANKGPIMIQSYNPVSGVVSDEFTLRSHAAHSLDVFGNELFAASTDGQADMAILSNGQWREVMGIDGDHWFDSLEYGGKIWLAGQKGNRATIASSSDRGVTWKVEHQDLNKVRFHFITEHNGKLYTQAGWDTKAYEYSPTANTWITIPPMTTDYGAKMISFAGKRVSMSYPPSSQTYIMNYLKIYDGSSEIMANFGGNSRVFDFKVYQDNLYVLDQSGGIYRTADLITWNKVASGPKAGGRDGLGIGRSMAIQGSDIYLGGADSNLYKLTIADVATSPKGGGNR